MAPARNALISLAAIAGLAAATAGAAPKPVDPPPTKEGAEYFEKKIRPILVRHCYECHSGDPQKARANFVLDTREGLRKGGQSGKVIVPGNADESLLIEAVQYMGLEMPPKEKLPDELIEELVKWVEMGAPDPRTGKAASVKSKIDLAEAKKYWAFQRPKAAAPPKVRDSAWPATDIDRFVQARREKERLQPAADADRVTLIRRVTFDLTGLPPTPEEIDAFVSDTSANAFASVVDRLLSSPRFGERWGRHWLDVVRYGESTGKERNIPFRYAWRYRDYVIDSFNADKPYDKFIVEQLAGDLLPAHDAAERDTLLVATGFLAIGTKGVNTKNPEQFHYDVVDDQIDVTGRAFLGMTVACARCHDHKYDPIPTTDYYAMAGIFHSTETFSGVRPGGKSATDKALLPLTDAARHAKGSSAEDKEQTARQEEMSQIEAKLAGLRKAQKKANKNPKGKKKGKADAVAAGPRIDPKQVREEMKKLQDRFDALEAMPSPPANLAMGVREGSPGNSPVLNRGELKDKGPEVPRGVLTVLKTLPADHVSPNHSGRLELAHWIASKNNPLTARVMVNRVWGHLFGQAIVPSTDNFGALGDEPTHPELLDHLALQFMDDKWSVKTLVRSIVLTRVYQMSSEHNSDNYAVDPSNRYLWRMERRRLDAEEIRDAMLAASGELDLERPEGSPVMQLPNAQLKGGKGLGEVRKPTSVRSVYLPLVRGNVPEMLQVFDAADPSLIMGKRDVTTVPTQALFLMNSSFAMKQSEMLAKRVLAQKGAGPAAHVDLAYRLALGRLPTEREKAEVARYLGDYRKSLEEAGNKGNSHLAAWASFCQTLFASGEFRYVY
ncbi:MAG: PSD1 and planctomycete cytochrome C domain-containing protein [Deltaproteobacteria bacterium]